MTQPRDRKDIIRLRHGFAFIAFWQFMAFLMLILLVWVNEVLDLASLLWGTSPVSPNIFRGAVLSAGVLITAVITVGHTYEQQKRVIRGCLTVCSRCKRVRLDRAAWERLEEYVARNSNLTFTHGVCPECFAKYESELRTRESAGGHGA